MTEAVQATSAVTTAKAADLQAAEAATKQILAKAQESMVALPEGGQDSAEEEAGVNRSAKLNARLLDLITTGAEKSAGSLRRAMDM